MFELVSKYQPSGDQPNAIKTLVDGINAGKKEQVLLGATGTGKTFTIANVIKEVNKKAFYTLTCKHCGKEFTAYGNQKRVYCCHDCYIKDKKVTSHE